MFVHEQHDIVDPGIQAAVADCPRWMVSVFKRVRPRFKYFPRGESLRVSLRLWQGSEELAVLDRELRWGLCK